MTEQTGEQQQASPELGFAFDRIPIQRVLDIFTMPELRQDKEADAIELALIMVQSYFKDGANLDIWRSYIETRMVGVHAQEQGVLSSKVLEQLEDVAQQVYGEHIDFMTSEADDVNRFIEAYPGVITSDAGGDRKLLSVRSESLPVTARVGRAEHSRPIRQEALWSDGDQEEIDIGRSVFVDMQQLPTKYSKVLQHYRILYDIDLDTV